MAFESLFSRPPSSALLDTHMTECQHAGDERTEAELEDGEIEDGGIEEEPEPEEEKKEEVKEEEEKNSSEKPHKKSRKRKKKEREKKKRRRREKHKHSDSSDSNDSDAEHPERPHKPPMYRDYDSHYSQRGHYSSHKKSRSGYDEYSNYSDGNYNEEEDDDYAEQLKHYRQSKEGSGMEDPPYKKGMKGGDSGGEQQQQQQQKVYYYGRGGGPHKKMMMRKDRGRGRGGHKGSYYQDGYQEEHKPKKWVAMSQEFINQHTVERNGKQICKYFLERRCVKGDQCKFDHDAEIEKKKEICKFYIQGFCTRGENCIYMHNEFPCKFFHTGAKCYQGDNCKFSHEPLNEASQELLNKVLNTEEEKLQEEEESEEMSRHGANYYNQPYMGMPFTSMYNSEPIPEPEPMTSPPMPMYGNHGMNTPFNQSVVPGHVPNQQRDGPPGPPFLQTAEENLHGMPLQNSYPHSQNAPGFYDNYYSQQTVHHAPASNISESVRKVLFSRLGKTMDGSESSQPLAPQRSVSREEDEFANWYSSEEEDGVSSILKTLRNQAKLARTNSAEHKPLPQNNDPRLAKDRTGGGQVFDPRVRPSQGQSPGHQGENVSSDPRVARDPRKVKPIEAPAAGQSGGSSGAKQQKVVDEDDEDAERELRDKAAIIPLEMLPGVTLRDPRLKLRQFSHIKMDIILSKPNFAKLIVWAPEDLLPVPPPKPDPVSSINLPLPPLIADQRLNKSRGLGELHPSTHDPRLERLDPRLEAKAKQANLASRSSFGDAGDPHVHKPSDPRLQKSLQSRFHRSPSSDSQPGAARDPLSPKTDPRLAARSAMGSSPTSVRPPQDVPLPFAPKVSPSSGRLGTPGSILKNISLYNPRDGAAMASEPSPTRTEENGDHREKNDKENKPAAEPEAEDSVVKPTSPPKEQPQAKETEGANDAEVKANDPEEKQEDKPAAVQASAAPAVHNLPVQALSGLIRPQYSDPRQVKPPGPTSQPSDANPEAQADDKPLKDVFKTFDPTASPFCQL